MKSDDPRDNSLLHQCPTVLVAVDFSQCCRLALKTVRDLFGDKGARFILLHVVDSNFIQQYTRHRVEDEGEVKKRLFLQAKAWLEEFVKEERLDGERVKRIVSEGIPFLEINRQAVENDADMIVVGTCGKALGDMDTIFFGSTAEKVLRFVTRPVLCVPPTKEQRVSVKKS